MPRFVEGVSRTQSTLFPDRLEDSIDEENPVRAIDAFVDTPGFSAAGISGDSFQGLRATGLPSRHHVEAVCLRLTEPDSVNASPGTENRAQY